MSENFERGPGPRTFVDGKTIEWLSKLGEYNTVCEYNVWDGQPEDYEEAERTRHVILMECNHDAIVRIHAEMYRHNETVARMILAAATASSVVPNVFSAHPILGWDFARNLPTITLLPQPPYEVDGSVT